LVDIQVDGEGTYVWYVCGTALDPLGVTGFAVHTHSQIQLI